MFYILRFLISWIVWLLLTDKKRWRELLMIGMIAGFVGSTVDNLMFQYALWKFPGAPSSVPTMLDDWGTNLVVTALFIQWLPQKKSFQRYFFYWLLWTLIALGIEIIHVSTGHMVYSKWWNLGWSYLSDWILFTLFYQAHKVFKLRQLSN